LKKLPFVSIIIVNYNGARLLGNCLSSLFKNKYPKNKFEVIVVDNNSRDDSRTFVKRNFPIVKLIKLSENKGFAAGNNEGYKHAVGELILLLNSDTIADQNWIHEMVAAASDQKVGIVASKILLNVPFVEVSISSTIAQQSDFDESIDFSPRGVLLENISSSNTLAQERIWYKSGFSEPTILKDITTRWSTGEAKILLPLVDEVNDFSFIIHGYPTHNNQLISSGSISIKNEPVVKFSISPNSIFRKNFTIHRTASKHRHIWLVQNAGNIVLKDGYSKDIGSVTRIINKQVDEFYEQDSAFFCRKRNLVAACGAGMLIKRAVINDISFFNEHYFMYYEDIDLSLRAWRQGWDIIFAPKAIIKHDHRATTGRAESAFLISMIEKNHLFLLLTNFPIRIFLKHYILFLFRLFDSILRQFAFRFKRWDLFLIWRLRASGRLSAFFSFHSQLLIFINIRYWWSTRDKRTYNQLEQHLY